MRRPPCPSRWTAIALAAILAAAGLACGKKGAPLPPLPGMTPRVVDLEVRQAGRGARATFTLPIRPGQRLVDYETRAVELWRRPFEPRAARPTTTPPRMTASTSTRGEPMPPSVPLKDFTAQGTLVASVSGSDIFDFLARPTLELADPSLPPDVPAEGLEYAVILKTDLRASGLVSNVATLVPIPAPGMPTDVKAEAIEGAVRIAWTAAPAPEPSAPESSEEGAAGASGPVAPARPPSPPAVNVYRAVEGGALGVEPVAGSPFSSSPFTDRDVVSGTTYRYVLRSVIEAGEGSVESDSTEEISARYVDVFPPQVPKGLRVIPEAGRVNLVWNPAPERDLGGYHVYRRARGGAWERIDAGALPSATFIDRTAVVGAPLEYAVSAYDRATPPNESDKSAPLSVTVEPAE